MSMETSQQRQSYQVQIGLERERLDSELAYAGAICSDLHSIRGTVGLLLALCKGGRKIDPEHLSGVLELLDGTLDGTEDSANGLRRFLECLAPAHDLQGAAGDGEAGLHLVSAKPTGES